jgi:hypothetical protein
MITAEHPGIDILGCSSPIELKQNRATAVDGDLTEGLSIEQILPHDSKCLLDDLAIKLFPFRHRVDISAPVPHQV